jgi:cell division inhibitor SepF
MKNKGFMQQVKFFLGIEESTENKEIETTKQQKNNTINLAYFKKSLSEIKIIDLKSFSDSIHVVEYLKQDIPVIVNLQHLNKMQIKRFMDFISGTIYSINGNIAKLSESILILSSEKITITEDNTKRIKSKNNANEEIVMNMMNLN